MNCCCACVDHCPPEAATADATCDTADSSSCCRARASADRCPKIARATPAAAKATPHGPPKKLSSDEPAVRRTPIDPPATCIAAENVPITGTDPATRPVMFSNDAPVVRAWFARSVIP